MPYSSAFLMSDLKSNGQPLCNICNHCKKRIPLQYFKKHIQSHKFKIPIFKKSIICMCGHTQKRHYLSKTKCTHHLVCSCTIFKFHHIEQRPRNNSRYLLPMNRKHMIE